MKKGFIFDIQRFSLEDGPGIRTTVFLKGCPLNCKWCANPESQSAEYEIMYFKHKCIGCGKCVENCQYNAISRSGNEIIINRELCKKCGICTKECNSKALQLVGGYYSVQEVTKILMKDKKYYDTSRGGVTISGGEPLMQYEFTKNLLMELKKQKVHTAIETSGFGVWKQISDVFKYTDLIFFDVKHIMNFEHKRGTGKDNTIILNNLEKLFALGYNIIVRLPLIPDYNSEYENILKTAKYVCGIGGKKIQLIPYHRLGVSKYRSIGKEYMLDIQPHSENIINCIKENLKNDLKVDIL